LAFRQLLIGIAGQAEEECGTPAHLRLRFSEEVTRVGYYWVAMNQTPDN
jgi:hypothetical protein